MGLPSFWESSGCNLSGAGPAQLANLKRVLSVMLVYASSSLPMRMAEDER